MPTAKNYETCWKICELPCCIRGQILIFIRVFSYTVRGFHKILPVDAFSSSILLHLRHRAWTVNMERIFKEFSVTYYCCIFLSGGTLGTEPGPVICEKCKGASGCHTFNDALLVP